MINDVLPVAVDSCFRIREFLKWPMSIYYLEVVGPINLRLVVLLVHKVAPYCSLKSIFDWLYFPSPLEDISVHVVRCHTRQRLGFDSVRLQDPRSVWILREKARWKEPNDSRSACKGLEKEVPSIERSTSFRIRNRAGIITYCLRQLPHGGWRQRALYKASWLDKVRMFQTIGSLLRLISS